MSKHTKGPWHAFAGQVRNEDGRMLADAVDSSMPAGEDICNTRLMAAAPDLLNALSVLANAAESRGIPVDAARAAIAKATGEPA